jgi:hypothetical protein
MARPNSAKPSPRKIKSIAVLVDERLGWKELRDRGIKTA